MTDHLKILNIITKGDVGGAQQLVFSLANAFNQNGMNTTVAFGQGDFLKKKLIHNSFPFINFNYLKRTHNPFANLLFIFELKKYLKNNYYDVVHFNSSNALSGALGVKMANPKIKTIFTFHGLSMLDKNYKISPLLKFLYFSFFKVFLKFVDKKVFVSQENYDFAIKNKLVKSGYVIYNGIDIKNFGFFPRIESQVELSKKIAINWQTGLIIGSIGRLSYQKNYEFLINIFPKILMIEPKTKLVIIGDGPEKKQLQTLINENNLTDNIYLTGDIPDAGKFIKAFNIFVLSSRYEGLSITLIEALAAGIPILASDVGGNKETLDDNSGYLYELNNNNDFFEKIIKLISQPEIRNQLSHESLKNSMKFDIKFTIESYRKIYSN